MEVSHDLYISIYTHPILTLHRIRTILTINCMLMTIEIKTDIMDVKFDNKLALNYKNLSKIKQCNTYY